MFEIMAICLNVMILLLQAYFKSQIQRLDEKIEDVKNRCERLENKLFFNKKWRLKTLKNL